MMIKFTEKFIIFPAKLTGLLLLSLIKANIDNLQRLNIKYGEREQAQLIPREVELKDEPLRKKNYICLCSLISSTIQMNIKVKHYELALC